MKTFGPLFLLLGAVVTTGAQNHFRAALNPVIPRPENRGVTGAAAFVLSNSTVKFTISFNLEEVVPSSARLVGPQATFSFDLGAPFTTVHSPGPWPNGYDGSTAFFGSFTIPGNLREDLIAGRTILHLLGTRVGDFAGPVLPAPPPQITSVTHHGSNVRIHFPVQAPYQYQVEYTDAVGATSSSGLTTISALSQTYDASVSDSVTAAGSRFYRIRRDLCCQ